MQIRPMQDDDMAEVQALVERCFGEARRGRTAVRLRGSSRPIAALSFVARDHGALIGAVSCHPIRWLGPGGDVRPLVLLGPLVSSPERRGEGIGLALLKRAAEALDAGGHDCVLIGDAPYYGRFGWTAGLTQGWELPGPVEPERLLLRASDPATYAGPARLTPAEAGISRAA